MLAPTEIRATAEGCADLKLSPVFNLPCPGYPQPAGSAGVITTDQVGWIRRLKGRQGKSERVYRPSDFLLRKFRLPLTMVAATAG
jgi:hypothetical protein